MELTKEYLLDALPTHLFGRRIYTFERIDSTNSCARTLADVGAEEGTLVVAEYQTGGRGRQGRAWLAEPRTSLLFSILIRPPLSQEQAGILPFYAAVAIARAVEPLVGGPVECKWPNDLLLSGKKFGGILVETAFQEGRVSQAIIGVGLNVNQRDFPDELSGKATSLAIELNKAVDRKLLLHAILSQMESLYETIHSGQTHSVLVEWLSRCTIIGKRVAVRAGDEVVLGRALEVRDTGALVLETAEGTTSYFAADVTFSDQSPNGERT
jgi:BirA family transcriptional regulator, biotin operon repressor / biotin---[acetyl-CoA-carboxylase] ligase